MDVQVAAVPSVGGRVEQPGWVGLDSQPVPRRWTHLALDAVELQPPGADDPQLRRRHRQRHVLAVEERSMVDIPLVRRAVGEPRSAGRVGDRPAHAGRRDEPQFGPVDPHDRTVDHRVVAARDTQRRVVAIDVDRLDRGATTRYVHLPARHRDDQIAVHRPVDHDVNRDAPPGDHRTRRPGVDTHATAGVDPHHHDAGGYVVTDDRADRTGEVPVLAGSFDHRAEQGEPRPPEERRQRSSPQSRPCSRCSPRYRANISIASAGRSRTSLDSQHMRRPSHTDHGPAALTH
jgi:hypothetical protein